MIAFELTPAMLRDWGACDHGVNQAVKYGILPCVISSEPEDNYDLAKRLIACQLGWRVQCTLMPKMSRNLLWDDESEGVCRERQRRYKTLANYIARIVNEAAQGDPHDVP